MNQPLGQNQAQVEQKTPLPWTFKSEPVIQTNFSQAMPQAADLKRGSQHNVASSTHLRQSIFRDDEWKLQNLPGRQSLVLSNANVHASRKQLSLREIFDETPKEYGANLHYKNDAKTASSFPSIPQGQVTREANNSEAQNYPTIRAASMRKLTSLETLPKLTEPINENPNELNDPNLEYVEEEMVIEQHVKMPSSQQFKADEYGSNVMFGRSLASLNLKTQPERQPSLNYQGSSRELSTPINKLEQGRTSIVQTLTLKDGSTYEGELYHNLPNGKGKESAPNGDVYIGSFSMGTKSGYGKFNFANGDKYRGNFENNKFNGMGTLFFANGNGYIGEFKNGLMNGIGTFSHADGKIDKGFWRNGELINRQNE
jgi:hypothetical protein